MKTNTSRAFTLIEILVVVGIIMLLAAILFPVFGSAQERARASTCLSNLKQLGVAWQMYNQDSDQKTLQYVQTAVGCPQTVLKPYTKNNQIWICPSESTPTALLGTDPTYVTYQFNYLLTNKPEAQFTRASELVLTFDADATEGGFVEGNSTDNGLTTDWPHLRRTGCPNTGNTPSPLTTACGSQSYLQTEFNRHNGTVNALYLDGHAKGTKAQMYADTNFVP